jgi:aromatase
MLRAAHRPPQPDGGKALTSTSPITAHAQCSVILAAPAAALSRLLGEIERWPLVFGPIVYAAAAEDRPHGVDLWVHADGGRVVHWTGEQWAQPDGLRFTFRRRPTAAGAVHGAWTLESQGPASTRVTLSWGARPGKDRAVDSPFGAGGPADRLAEFAAYAELGESHSALVFAFEDTVHARGSAEDALRFLARVQDWPGAISHVAAVTLDEPEPGVQFVGTAVRTGDGGVQEVPSIRLCMADRVVYTPLTVPPFASAHLGEWIVTRRPDGTAAITGRHTVALRPDRIAAAFGPHATPADARSRVRAALGAHSLATLEAARSHAESLAATTTGG